MSIEKIDWNLLKSISETPGAPGFEKQVRELIIDELKSHVDEYYTDNMGNLITIKRSKKADVKKFMFAAHMDEIGFMVKHIDDNGYIRFQTLGGFDPKTLTSMRVLVHGKKDLLGVMGCKPIHSMTPAERQKVITNEEYFIDCGLSKEEITKHVKIGDSITRSQNLEMVGNLINGKSLDDRVCVYALVEVMKSIKAEDIDCDVYGVFTVQEEVGLRGAQVAGHGVSPDFGIALDVTVANDIPGLAPENYVTQMGKGVGIKHFDGGTICDRRMVELLEEVADQNEIPHQAEILPFGGTDTANIQRMPENGAIAGALSIPMRYLHQTVEMAEPGDVCGMVELCCKVVENSKGLL
ncbi:M20/M25/M40 family metallo-hydrolase [Flammeovirga yaeyamensis]|uniref:M20/M25/M40 family metallo-hydrolase n=1 Tax=Flammeovirga yaeyamensis TaxID=367791 RepID=A0AAX1N2I6_9BACT|nr:M42 family metallopeptidase [Flammeovirga yaeyamensis]MBB3696354.1 endoglucanase [Flammeovirga yaeyamensis]NMF35033.1 M42 family metallopeptidase [Flammeovirga yaeyamensis]QWG00143.1 M20/M25/M40 family metallo-hydrolase [Flammeovirga yaeyamensis]